MTQARVVRSWTLLAGVALSVVAAAGCGDSPTAPSHYAPYSQTDLVVGTGAEAVAGTLVTLNYTGWFYDVLTTDHKGVQFDSSVGRDPLSFTLGAGEVISGMDQGVVGMRVGGVRRLVIPPSLGYGASRVGRIPGNATLVFEVELVSVGAQ